MRGPFPILFGKSVKGKIFDAQFATQCDDGPDSVSAPSMPSDTGKSTLFGPPAVSIHNDGHMFRQALFPDGWHHELEFNDLLFLLGGRFVHFLNELVGDFLNFILTSVEFVFTDLFFSLQFLEHIIGFPPEIPD